MISTKLRRRRQVVWIFLNGFFPIREKWRAHLQNKLLPYGVTFFKPQAADRLQAVICMFFTSRTLVRDAARTKTVWLLGRMLYVITIPVLVDWTQHPHHKTSLKKNWDVSFLEFQLLKTECSILGKRNGSEKERAHIYMSSHCRQ